MDGIDFKPGERVTFAGDEYEVVANYGDTGLVRDGSGDVIKFRWMFEGEQVRRLNAN